jgi:uncharacterized protein (DUF433 family)
MATDSSFEASSAFYGGIDPRDIPRYNYPEASRATGVPPSTIATWVREAKSVKGLFRPVIERPGEGRLLSFFNLIEVHVLRSLRTKHRVQLQHVREAAAVAEAEYDIQKLLLSQELCFNAGDLFLQRYGEIIQLSRAEQLALHGVLGANLKRIDWIGGQPRDFSPLERVTQTGKKLILVSPSISFGRPIVSRLGITTRAIADRINAGEPANDVVLDYGLTQEELTEALAYESAA